MASRFINQQRVQTPRVLAVDCPIGGWNARDSLDSMESDDAVVLDNWVPGFNDCFLRPGYTSFATGVGAGSVESMMLHENLTNRHLLAAASGGIYRIDPGGAIGAPLASGFLNDRWQDDMFIGQTIMVNGADTPQSYDGTAVTALVLTGTGLVPNNLNGVRTHNSRAYFWENASPDLWYSGPLALGTLTKFPLAGVASGGGNIVDCISWTRETSGGMLDYLVILMTSGLALVYAGSDPGDTANWGLVGTYTIGQSVGIRGSLDLGADAVLITADGYQPLNTALQGGRAATRFNVSDKIQSAAQREIFKSSGNFGWDMVYYPSRNWMLINYPASASTFEQHVVNLRSGAWCRFKGIQAQCWRLFNDRLYFGGATGNVFLFDEGASDNGANIIADGLAAYNYLGSRTNQKMVNTLRVVASSDGDLPLEISVQRDLGIDPAGDVLTNFLPGDVGTAEWDKATWDLDSWAGEQIARDVWLDRGGLGYSFALRVKYNGQGREVRWLSYTYSYEFAAPI